LDVEIVWAEDEEGDRVLIRTALDEVGFGPVGFASRGEDVLAAVGKRRPRLVVLDINMPGMNGVEVLRRLRGDPATRDLRVVMFSTAKDEADGWACTQLGVTDFVLKPLELDLFAYEVQRIAARARA
jgi:CheY-like chemotaxis protein